MAKPCNTITNIEKIKIIFFIRSPFYDNLIHKNKNVNTSIDNREFLLYHNA